MDAIKNLLYCQKRKIGCKPTALALAPTLALYILLL